MTPTLGEAVETVIRIRDARVAHMNYPAILAGLRRQLAEQVRAAHALEPGKSAEALAAEIAGALAERGVEPSYLGVSHDSIRAMLAG